MMESKMKGFMEQVCFHYGTREVKVRAHTGEDVMAGGLLPDITARLSRNGK